MLTIQPKTRALSFGLLGIFTMSACGQDELESTAAPISELPTKTQSSATTSNVPLAMNLKDQVNSAKDDLAERLNLSEDKISLLQSSLVTWRSSAAGCPEAGTQYMQALTPGALIIFGVDGKHYRYHATKFTKPFLCDSTQAESPISESSEI